MRAANIGIIGAGISGLSAGVLLMRAGHRVRIYEQAREIGEVGAGLSIPPNAAHVIAEMGLSASLKAASDLPDYGRILNGKTGDEIKHTPFGDLVKDAFGERYYQLHRADMIGILEDAARTLDPDCIRTDHAFERYDAGEDKVSIHFSNREMAQADILIGADGVKSRVRGQMHGPEDPFFTGYVVWRALIPMETLPEYYHVPRSSVWIGKGRNATFYPIRHGSLLNCVFFAADQDWTDEGWNIAAHPDEIRAAYDGYHARIHTLCDAMPEASCFKWGLFGRDPIKTWSQGRAVLIGDAAHPMLPFLGQGASMALEDAAALSAAVNAAPDFERAFSCYIGAREERANWVLMESRAAGDRFVADEPSGETFGEDGAMKSKHLFGYRTPSFADS